MDIESNLGVGTKVSIELPVAIVNDGLEIRRKASDIELATKSYKVLIAEDDADISVLLEVMLSESGVDATIVENGALAVAAVKQEEFDIVLLDVHMPVLDGYQTLERLKQEGFEMPVIVMSASSLDADRSKAHALGAAAYLVKPVDIGDLHQMIEQVLG